jgi:hypothetical protein
MAHEVPAYHREREAAVVANVFSAFERLEQMRHHAVPLQVVLHCYSSVGIPKRFRFSFS